MLVEILKAQKADAPVVVELMYKALGDYANFLMNSQNTEETLLRMQICFTAEKPNAFHYTNSLVAMVDGKIVGESTSYAGNRIAEFNNNISKIIAKFQGHTQNIITELKYLREARADEYYMDTLSVIDEYKSLGVGKLLLQGVCQKALSDGFSKLSIVVQEGKEYLLDYYLNQGFNNMGMIDLGGINYHRLLKIL
ncbi:MAG: GNAT family N-acetyltransferase [Alphaproteobacteria bacterium]|jgi:ribosomal protein S18 acetylase RimI-like enzyme|nr:GNAT family N-acetyltransferase [Alphaproteobacteria bacterium]